MKKKTWVLLFSICMALNNYAQKATVAEPIVIEAIKANGGEIIKTDKGTSGILFSSTMPVNSKMTWALPNPLPSGLWQVDIEFYQPNSPFSPNQILLFEGKDGEKLASFDLYYIDYSKGIYTRSIIFYNSKPFTAIKIIKNVQRNINTVAICSIKIIPTTVSTLEMSRFVFQLPVDANYVKLPFSLPNGAYIVNSEKCISLKWTLNNDRNFRTPSASETRVYLNEPVNQLTTDNNQLNNIQLTHYPATPSSDMSSAGNAPLMLAGDTTIIESQTLQLIGYNGKETPKLDIFPYGKTMAVVTSWDDGKPQDEQLATYLTKYNMKGTFFMNRGSAMNSRLEELESKGMEIGSHSWSHPAFYNSSPKRCVDEAVEIRRYLEKITGHPIISFAYPFNYQPAYDKDGDYVLRSLRQAGYWSGRATTTGENQIDSIMEPLAMKPNFHFKIGSVKIKEKFDELIQKSGSIIYIWGHSYELANDGAKIFEDVLSSIANDPKVWYATLGELMVWQFTRKQLKIEPSTIKGNNKNIELRMPWLHPYLQQTPISLVLPKGVKYVLWKGNKIPVVNDRIQLKW